VSKIGEEVKEKDLSRDWLDISIVKVFIKKFNLLFE
jgi:hypothetical protein